MVKAKIHPDQYKEISDKIESLEIPQSIRKPRVRKEKINKQTDIPIIIGETKTKSRTKRIYKQSDIIPKEGIIREPVKETQNKKRKIIQLD